MRKKFSLQDVSMNKIIGVLFAIISSAFLIGGIILFFASGETDDDNKEEQRHTTSIATADSVKLPSTVSAETEVTTQEITTFSEETTEYESIPENQAEQSEIPQELQTLLSMGNCNSDTLDAVNTNQLIVVNSGGTTANISFYEKTNEKWAKDENLTCTGFVGSEGTVTYMSEQVSGTPKGFYSIGSAFYQYNAPYTCLNTFKITNDTYWIDDPDSKFYNQRVEGVADKDWKSAEHMMSIPNYKYGFVINYNTPAEYNKGSAIFFHIGSNPTNGCVAASENMVLAYLAKLNAGENPYILII